MHNGLLPYILDRLTTQIVMDVGSVKERLCLSVANHPCRGNFVATQPMWGTEYSGPEAAVSTAFINKAVVFFAINTKAIQYHLLR